MKASASRLQPSALAGKSPAGDTVPATANPGLWTRLVARVRSWFEIPYGYEDENGFHYGIQPRPIWRTESESAGTSVFTDKADQAMTYPMALPKVTAEAPTPSAEPTAVTAKG